MLQKQKYDFSIFIGRFQPFHILHREVVEFALSISDKLIILIGSDNKPIDWKNPWTTKERIEMIKQSLSPSQLKHIIFQSIEDRLYQDKEWQVLAYNAVNSVLLQYSTKKIFDQNIDHVAKMCIVGFDKDETSWYLNYFPQWKFEEYKSDKDSIINSTDIRTFLYNEMYENIKPLVSNNVYHSLMNWKDSESGKYVIDWFKYDINYSKPYLSLPYTTNFYCGDNVVFQSGHVLLVRRSQQPAKGLWALPGGHINVNEKAYTGSVRELYEETNIKIPEKVMHGSFFGEKLFDHPDRSLRGRSSKRIGRTISISHCFVLNDSQGLPRVHPSNETSEVWWFPLAEVRNMRNQMMEDHLDQINYWAAQVEK